jgi:hypothetical protein
LEDPSIDGEDNIIMDVRLIGGDRLDWIRLAQDRDQWWAVMHKEMILRVP